MPTLVERLSQSIENGTIDRSLLPESVERITELQKRVDELEEILIILVRTGWPWDEEGEANEILNQAGDGFGTAMKQGQQLLQLDRSRLTRTEPRT